MYSICKAYGKKAHIIIDYDSLEEKTGVIARSLRDDELIVEFLLHRLELMNLITVKPCW